jgi:hypothetical protein
MKTTKSLYTLPWLLLFPFIAHAGDVPGTHANYQWDPAVTSLTSIDFNVAVDVDPGYRANVLWGTRFALSGSNQIGRAGIEDNANVGPNFVFTVRGATQYKSGAPGSYCVVHTGDNTRVTCRLPYNWINTHPYQFHVAYEGGQWLGVTVTDTYTPQQSFKLGSILTDTTSISPQGMVGKTAYLEASSPNSNCYNQPYTEATFSGPTGNGGQFATTIASVGINAGCASFSGINPESNGYSDQTNGFGNLPRGVVIGDDNLCVDAGNGKTNGAAITSQTCDKKAEGQAWVFAEDGTVRLQSNLCLDVANADPSSGAVVIADQCNGSAGQYWTLGGFNNIIQSNINQFCLTEGAAGAQMTMQDCSAGPVLGQNWTVPEIPVLP